MSSFLSVLLEWRELMDIEPPNADTRPLHVRASFRLSYKGKYPELATGIEKTRARPVSNLLSWLELRCRVTACTQLALSCSDHVDSDSAADVA
ncbi:hypothetical protein MRB53_040109 [Persea americana]|nr:hypothetical protein MRB53_040109 [Persea americana]